MSTLEKRPACSLVLRIVVGLIFGIGGVFVCARSAFAEEAAARDAQPLRCVAFSPYVNGYSPLTGPHPSRSRIGELLDRIKPQFDCIMTYGMLHGLDATFAEAKKRGIQVIAIIWLDKNPSENSESITAGIRAARKYPRTIIRLSCGSEMRARNGDAFDGVTQNCLNRLRAARPRLPQPITAIDTWWEVCRRSWPSCQRDALFASLDWIGVNVYPWWENKFSGHFPCTTAEQAAEFVSDRLQDVMDAYPGKEIILTEFGWPAGPKGYSEVNMFTGQTCGVANQANQAMVLEDVMDSLDQHGWSGVLFEAFQEAWKVGEGPVGPFWGICKGNKPYTCKRVR